MAKEFCLKETRFSEQLVKHNHLHERGFAEWFFYSGMLFGASDKWWGKKGKRDAPHEGIDLCLFKDRSGRICRLAPATEIPAIYDGVVVNIEDDFLGESIYVRHSMFDKSENQLYTIYGHTRPVEGLAAGKTLKEGKIIAAIEDTRKNKARIPAHLHISIALIAKTVEPKNLSWEILHDADKVILLNPVQLIANHLYSPI